MADTVAQPDPVSMLAAQGDATAAITVEPKANVKTEQITTSEPMSGEQSVVKIEKEEMEKVTEQSSSVKENRGDAAGTKAEDTITGELGKEEHAGGKGAGRNKPSVKGPYKHRNNSKFDPSVAEVSSDPVEIRKQARLPSSNYLQRLTSHAWPGRVLFL